MPQPDPQPEPTDAPDELTELESEPEPAPRPPTDSRAEQRVIPGQSLRLLLPPIGPGRNALALLVVIALWGALLLNWQARIETAPSAWKLIFLGPQWIALALLALRLAWLLFGRVELCADPQTFAMTRRLFGLRLRRRFPMPQVEGIRYRLVARAVGPQDDRSLFVVVRGKDRLLATHMSRAVFEWARYELSEFLDSLEHPPYNPPNVNPGSRQP